MTSIIVDQNYGHNLVRFFTSVNQIKEKSPGKVFPELFFTGAEGQNRTADTGIFSPLLYRLSYLGSLNLTDFSD